MFRITSINGHPNDYEQKEFLLTDVADLDKLPRAGIRGSQDENVDSTANLPCGYGSIALVTQNSSTDVYILTPNNEWVKM